MAYIRGDTPPFANVGSQAHFLEPRPNGTKIDHLFRYEDVDGQRGFLQGRFAQEITFERLNVSSGTAPKLLQKTEQRFRRKMAEEFELWDSIQTSS